MNKEQAEKYRKHFHGDGSDADLDLGIRATYVCLRPMMFRNITMAPAAVLDGNGHIIRISGNIILAGGCVILLKPIGGIRINWDGLYEIKTAKNWKENPDDV